MQRRYYLYAIFLLFFIVGCSQKPIVTKDLKTAWSDYMKLKQDPKYENLAQQEYMEATKYYNISHKAYSKDDAKHLAYMLRNQIKVLKEAVKSKELLSQMDRLKEQRTQLLIEKKQKELELLEQKAKEAKQKEQISQDRLSLIQTFSAKQKDSLLTISLNSNYFDLNQHKILPKGEELINSVSKLLKDSKSSKVFIKSYATQSSYNLDLALRLVSIFKESFIKKGVDDSQIITKTALKSSDDNSTDINIEIMILDGESL